MNQYQITQYEAWLADFMDANVEHFQATRYTDDEGEVGYSGLSEWYSEDADYLATMGIQYTQAQQGTQETDFVWPSDQDRAESHELNRVCEELEKTLDQLDNGQNAEPVDELEFGKGEFVVARGTYGKQPAVFIAPVQNGPGRVGENPGDKEPIGAPRLLPGERVMTFPTIKQARAVAQALQNKLTYTQPQIAGVPEGWIKCSERLPTDADEDCDGAVWVCDCAFHRPKYAQKRVHWETVPEVQDYTHWMPTGLKRPQPPQQGGE